MKKRKARGLARGERDQGQTGKLGRGEGGKGEGRGEEGMGRATWL